MLDQHLSELRTLDWDNLDAVQTACGSLLDTLVRDRALLHSLVTRVTSSPFLSKLCEHYDILDKLVIYDDDARFRIRLHIFLPGYFDRPHNHRWTYCSRILRGSYRHSLFGQDTGLWEGIDVDQLKPLMVRTETVGSTYTLSHQMVHSVVAEPHTVSLIVRGPAVKGRFLVADRRTNRAWWQYGATSEPEQVAAAKRMSPDQIRACASLLGLVSDHAGLFSSSQR